jgi:hypothetical protein
MKILRKLILLSVILCSKNILAANFTVNIGGKTIDNYNDAVASDPDIDTIIFNSDNETLSVNNDNTELELIQTNSDNNGIIKFITTDKTLEVNNNIGDKDQKLSQVISDVNNFSINALNLYANQLIINLDTTIGGAAILNFGDIVLNDSTLSLSNEINISGDIDIASSGDIYGSNTSLTFNGSSYQLVNSTIGLNGAVGNINIANSVLNQINFNKDVTVQNINFNNSETATLSLSDGVTFDLSGDITNSGSSDALITNSYENGILKISGSGDKSIDAKIGESSDSRFDQIDIENSGESQINFLQNTYLNILDIKNNNATINNQNVISMRMLFFRVMLQKI